MSESETSTQYAFDLIPFSRHKLFAEGVRNKSHAVYQYAMWLLGNNAQAKSLTEHAFAELWQSELALDDSSENDLFLARIVKRHAEFEAKGIASAISSNDTAYFSPIRISTYIDDGEKVTDVCLLARQLSNTDREAIESYVLHYFLEFDVHSIARHLCISREQAETFLKQAKKQLRVA